jgi:hypothetical protein
MYEIHIYVLRLLIRSFARAKINHLLFIVDDW